MEVGDKIKFPFGGKEKEGVIVKIFPKKVYLKADFARHPGKLVVRTLAELEGKRAAPKKKRKAKKVKTKKEPLQTKEAKEAKEEKE
jgi:hypothetical protein